MKLFLAGLLIAAFANETFATAYDVSCSRLFGTGPEATVRLKVNTGAGTSPKYRVDGSLSATFFEDGQAVGTETVQVTGTGTFVNGAIFNVKPTTSSSVDYAVVSTWPKKRATIVTQDGTSYSCKE